MAAAAALPQNLRKVELLVPGIGAGDNDAADGVSGPMPKSALALLKETRVLVKNGRENCLDHEVFDGAVGSGRSETFRVSLGALSVAGFAVLRLAYASQSSVPGDLDVVERAASHYLEFLADGRSGGTLPPFSNVRKFGRAKKSRSFEVPPVLSGVSSGLECPWSGPLAGTCCGCGLVGGAKFPGAAEMSKTNLKGKAKEETGLQKSSNEYVSCNSGFNL